MTDSTEGAIAGWLRSITKGGVGAQYDSALEAAERSAAEGERTYEIGVRMAAIGDYRNSVNAFMTSARLHMDAADYYERVARLSTTDRQGAMDLIVANRAAAQRSIEAVHAVDDTPLESTTSAGLPGVTVDESPVWPVTTPNNPRALLKSALTGHPFWGNQWTTAGSMAERAAALESHADEIAAEREPGVDPTPEQAAEHLAIAAAHRELADEHRDEASQLETVAAEHDATGLDEGHEDASTARDAAESHERAADAHDRAADSQEVASNSDEFTGQIASENALRAANRSRMAESMSSDVNWDTDVDFSPPEYGDDEMEKSAFRAGEAIEVTTDEDGVEVWNLGEVGKGARPGHPFYGNQWGGDAGSLETRATKLAETTRPTVSEERSADRDAHKAAIREHKEIARKHREIADAMSRVEGMAHAERSNRDAARAHDDAAKEHRAAIRYRGDPRAAASDTASWKARGRSVLAAKATVSSVDRVREQLGDRMPALVKSGGAEITKGDSQGHPFRGNQWKDAVSTASRVAYDVMGGDGGDDTVDTQRGLSNSHAARAVALRALASRTGVTRNERDSLEMTARSHDTASRAHDRAADTESRSEDGRAEAAFRAATATRSAANAENTLRELHGSSLLMDATPQPAEIGARATSSVVNAVMANGGATISQTGEAPTDGYIVATDERLGRVVTGDQFRDKAEARRLLADYIEDNIGALSTGQKFLGLWHRTEDDEGNPLDEVHFDIVEKMDDLDEAVKAGAARNQISVWDVVNAREIPTGGSGSGTKKE